MFSSHLNWYCFTMSIKKLVIQLEKWIHVKFPEYNPKFYSNRRNNYIHIGLDSSLFGYANFKKLLDEVDCFLNENLRDKFISVSPPKLIHSTKWKHDYIVKLKKRNLENTTNLSLNTFQMT